MLHADRTATVKKRNCAEYLIYHYGKLLRGVFSNARDALYYFQLSAFGKVGQKNKLTGVGEQSHSVALFLTSPYQEKYCCTGLTLLDMCIINIAKHYISV